MHTKYYKTARPSKTALYRKICQLVGDNTYRTGIDCACANFSNRMRFFPVERYVGIDLDRGCVESGIGKFPDDTAILADMCKVELPKGCADLVISSNSIYHIKDDSQRLLAVKNISSWVSPEGKLLIELSNESPQVLAQIKEELQGSFDQVSVFGFGNKLSLLYERLVLNCGDSIPKNIFGGRFFVNISWLISLLELGGNCGNKKHTLFYCSGKKEQDANEFTLSDKFTKNSDGYFEYNGQ